MSAQKPVPHELCWGCVYYPPNLPQHAYSASDWRVLQERACSFEHRPDSPECLAARKTSCSLVDLAANLPKPDPQN